MRRTQRDVMRELLTKYGYNKDRVLAAYADAERRGYAPRDRNLNDVKPEAYAEVLWADGHQPRGPWILAFCKKNGIKVLAYA